MTALTRRLFLGLGAGIGAGWLSGCTDDSAPSAPTSPRTTRTADPLPDAHLALTSPKAHAQLVLARSEPSEISAIARIAAGFQATAGFGPRMLPDLASLRAIPEFDGDVLDPDRSQSDLILLFEDAHADRARQRASAAMRALEAHATSRWRVSGSHQVTPGAEGLPIVRNVFGFAEGFGNPVDPVGTTLLSAPHWAKGGSLLAMRVIRVSHRLWNLDGPDEHIRVMGRRPDGRWPDGSPATAAAPFDRDPEGLVVDLDSHVRRANPRTAGAPAIPLQRRGWNYATQAGEEGTLFMAFTNDLNRFEAVQLRVIGDRLTPYTLTVGGGYFFVPPPHDAWMRRRMSPTA